MRAPGMYGLLLALAALPAASVQAGGTQGDVPAAAAKQGAAPRQEGAREPEAGAGQRAGAARKGSAAQKADGAGASRKPGTAKEKAAAQKPAELDPEAAARRYFTDTEVVDQHGRRHRFYSDLMKGRRVLINFAFTSCKTACSPITSNLTRVQKQLGERAGRDVWMLTLSVDPVNDTPESLRRFADKFKVGPGWLFLTAPPDQMRALLRKLGGDTEDPDKHSTALLIGDTGTGNWVKTVAMDRPERIVDAVLRLNDAPERSAP